MKVKYKKLKKITILKKKFSSPISTSKKSLLDPGFQTDKKFRQFIYDLSAAASLLEVARSYLAKQLNISSPQYNILMVVAQYQTEIGVTVSEVANHLHVTLAHVATESKILEKLGLLEIEVNPEDRRSKLLKIHKESESQITKFGTVRRGVNDALFQHLSKSEFENLSTSLGKLVQDFEIVTNKLKNN